MSEGSWCELYSSRTEQKTFLYHFRVESRSLAHRTRSLSVTSPGCGQSRAIVAGRWRVGQGRRGACRRCRPWPARLQQVRGFGAALPKYMSRCLDDVVEYAHVWPEVEVLVPEADFAAHAIDIACCRRLPGHNFYSPNVGCRASTKNTAGLRPVCEIRHWRVRIFPVLRAAWCLYSGCAAGRCVCRHRYHSVCSAAGMASEIKTPCERRACAGCRVEH